MKIDLTYELNQKNIKEYAQQVNARDKSLMSMGHFGTHFDTMNKEFPLDYTECNGIIFDVSSISGREIDAADIDLEKVHAGDFVIFYTGVINRYAYGSAEYTANQAALSWNLIEALVAKKIHMIGMDNRGLRRGEEHPKADKYCSDRGVFVIENLANLDKLIGVGKVVIHTYPLNLKGFTGIPSRVIAEILE